jgi:UPF0176 protein
MYTIAALYHFTPLDKLNSFQAALRDLCESTGVKGTILLANEGINGTISGPDQGINQVLEWLQADPRLAGMRLKKSFAEAPPFRQLKVRIKKEIVTMGVPEMDPTHQVGTHVKPKDWNALISDPEVVLVDTRNTYESDIGTFKGAVLPKIKGFREFPGWVDTHGQLPKDQKVAMFCTGGIRCEKATAYYLAEGYQEVFHLDGGILKYLEEIPEEDSLWEGDCFVFDDRVSVDHQLQPGDHTMCPACGRAVDKLGRAHVQFEEGVSCLGCFEETTPKQKARFAERQRQVDLAEARGEQHIGAVFSPPKIQNTHPAVGPILYSFRRCPYAIRARLALAEAGVQVRLREVVLRNKPPCLLELSPKATVPVLVLEDGTVIEESLEIMDWAKTQTNSKEWFSPGPPESTQMRALIERTDGYFKHHLDRYKYSTHFEDENPLEHRQAAEVFLDELEALLRNSSFLFSEQFSYADAAIAPFIRQFASTDREWFNQRNSPKLLAWLDRFLDSDSFLLCMKKYKQWYSGDRPVLFPEQVLD